MTNTALSRADLATQSTTLRAELKQWEKTFAEANRGRKAGRGDIKKDPAIAAKYKAYGRLRALEASTNVEGNELPESRSQQIQQLHTKRKHDLDRKNGSTPRKHPRYEWSTPSNGRTSNIHPSQLDPYDSPSTLRRLFSPKAGREGQLSPPLKTAIGPTPERDGKALGIFDLLSASGGSAATPSAKRVSVESRESIQTPSRRKTMDTILEEDEGILREGRTPASSSKRWYLEKLFATPTTMRYASIVEHEESDTRGNTSINGVVPEPLESGTPSFLRRSHSGRLTSNPTSTALDLSPVRKPPIFIGKGLTALVQGLRDMEEEQNLDDLEALREVEAERAAKASENTIEVGDSQALENEGEKQNRTWKKKGQKRTTRRVKMKPLPLKSNPAHAKTTKPKGDSDDELATSPPTPASPQTSRVCEENNGEEGEDNTAGCDDFSINTASEADPELEADLDYDADVGASKQQGRSLSEKIKAAFSVVKNVKSASEKTMKSIAALREKKPKQSAARKINAQAHTNYRSLKLRNRESRRGGRRFGRRR
ncbi:DNA replication/checkpoint protein [Elaphomyces granulatus]